MRVVRHAEELKCFDVVVAEAVLPAYISAHTIVQGTPGTLKAYSYFLDYTNIFYTSILNESGTTFEGITGNKIFLHSAHHTGYYATSTIPANTILDLEVRETFITPKDPAFFALAM